MSDCTETQAFLDEFDRLLEQSSLGTPNAKALQALTPPHVYTALEERLRTLHT